MIRVCPERDARCPHGMDCPHSIDRYRCDIEASRAALSTLVSTPPVSGEVGELVERLKPSHDADMSIELAVNSDDRHIRREVVNDFLFANNVLKFDALAALTAANADRDRLARELEEAREALADIEAIACGGNKNGVGWSQHEIATLARAALASGEAP